MKLLKNMLVQAASRLSAGICDSCTVPKLITHGNGINEPFYPILYCEKVKREICPELPEDRCMECVHYTSDL